MGVKRVVIRPDQWLDLLAGKLRLAEELPAGVRLPADWNTCIRLEHESFPPGDRPEIPLVPLWKPLLCGTVGDPNNWGMDASCAAHDAAMQEPAGVYVIRDASGKVLDSGTIPARPGYVMDFTPTQDELNPPPAVPLPEQLGQLAEMMNRVREQEPTMKQWREAARSGLDEAVESLYPPAVPQSGIDERYKRLCDALGKDIEENKRLQHEANAKRYAAATRETPILVDRKTYDEIVELCGDSPSVPQSDHDREAEFFKRSAHER